MELVYDELRGLARGFVWRRPPQPFQPTELVHEAFLKLVASDGADWRGRSHFYTVAATAMRQILVDEARKRLRRKRGDGKPLLLLDEEQVLSISDHADVLAVHEAIEALASRDPVKRGSSRCGFSAG